ncbi:regulatory protein RecX [Thiocapsa marina]|uniref:Regulatory protein RecX n=1 Tax=Thiocapsa marina 5811 TaxID=768671 RepID=F9UA16_9GAMM|nr:regulatory protein RecX [Thiocapsa marina]EGV18964.1 Regulatory protein recX [Thiocapsa marina 5811]
MAEPDPLTEIVDRARRLLAIREHSRLELTRKLRSRGFDDAGIAQAIDRLVVEGALDEDRMVEQYVAERAAKGFGPLRIRAELYEKGLPDTLVDPHLDTMRDDWVAYMAEIYDRRFGTEPPSDRTEYARRGRFLEQRGFPSEMIRRFLRRPD